MVITENKNLVDRLFIFIGILGALTTFSGLFTIYSHPFYIVGSFLLFLTALYFRLFFFVALEIIFISGHTAALLGIGMILQVALPVLLSFQLLFYYLFSGETSDFSIIIGILGIALFSVGFSIASQWVFMLGSLSISTYAYFNLEKSNKISLIWLILNLMFALTAFIHIIVF
ncbi:hypothetical protein [Legionella sp. W05-934-2]|uniref:hypothetical protein n=1 Tax=Legionella sp. W05-934-2 TaxID=1198649 RepID=UPI003461F6AE